MSNACGGTFPPAPIFRAAPGTSLSLQRRQQIAVAYGARPMHSAAIRHSSGKKEPTFMQAPSVSATTIPGFNAVREVHGSPNDQWDSALSAP